MSAEAWDDDFDLGDSGGLAGMSPLGLSPALKLAKKQIATVNIQRIQDISVGAMVFYSWASGVLDEITQNDFSLF